MKIEKPKNSTYCATVIEINNLIKLDNCDNVVATSIFGYQAIVDKNTKRGDIGLVFPAETQLSEKYCKNNNLFRHSNLNKDKNKTGYIEDNRRVKAVKFRGNISNCLFMPLSSLVWTGIDVNQLKVGDDFDHLNGQEICRKYVRKMRVSRVNIQPKAKKFNRVDPRFMPEHFRTDQFFKFASDLNPETEVIVSQKLHGTSIRIGHTICKRKLSLIEKIAKKFLGAKIQETEFDYVYGSRRAVKDVHNPYQEHYYGEDLWTQEGEKLKGLIPKNYILYGELIGWTSQGSPIQQGYTYEIEPGLCELYVYRIAIINDDGVSSDLSWDHMIEFCNSIGVNVVPEIWRGKLKDLKINDFLDKRLFDIGYRNCLSLGDNDFVDEGVVVRVDHRTPYCMKAKGQSFLEYETRLIDKNVQDIEAEQDVVLDDNQVEK